MLRTVKSTYTDIMVNSGATWGDTEVPDHGFMVSIKAYEDRFDYSDFDEQLISAYEEMTPLSKNTYYGAWIDGDSVYLDLSMWVETLDDALIIADIENQLAIFDLSENQTIKTELF